MRDKLAEAAAKVRHMRGNTYGLKRLKVMAIDLEIVDAVLDALMEPDPRMIAATLPLIAEPTHEQRELGKRALALLPPVRIEQHYKGEIAAAEVVRDWQQMLTAARSGRSGER